MSQPSPAQPSLSDLFARYLARQADACAVGVAAWGDEVTPYEAGPVQPIDPKLAWDEALAIFALAEPPVSTRTWKAPPAWSNLVASHEPVVALALAAGNFPQLVRNFHMILQTANRADLRPQPGRPTAPPDLIAWAESVADAPRTLLALGTLRLAKQFDAADTFVRKHDAHIAPAWRTAWSNEKAALAWHAGRADEALALWRQLEPTVAVRFNRGMAQLMMGDSAAARADLDAAVARLPQTSAWHHLGRLYLALTR